MCIFPLTYLIIWSSSLPLLALRLRKLDQEIMNDDSPPNSWVLKVSNISLFEKSRHCFWFKQKIVRWYFVQQIFLNRHALFHFPLKCIIVLSAARYSYRHENPCWRMQDLFSLGVIPTSNLLLWCDILKWKYDFIGFIGRICKRWKLFCVRPTVGNSWNTQSVWSILT